VNEVGELVITKPMPSMPIYFWGDSDGSRYRSSYFEMFPGVWRHGDWIKITDRGTAVIYGRSDSTITRGGVRMGTSEIYSAVEGVDEVLDSLVVDIGDEMILFVAVRDALTGEVVAEIRRRLREHCSPRHVPDRIVEIPEVPRTLSNKKLEVPVKKILLGAAPESAASRYSLANPEALDWIADFSVRVS
jgi:acetoacetyl-CoA synthetase